jgi:hypothetical protein
MASGPASGDDRVIASRPTVCAMITATTRSAAAGRQQARVPRHADQNQGHADVEQPQAQVCRPLQPGPRAAVPARRSGSASAPRSWPRRAPAGAGPATPVPAPAGVRRPPPLPPAGTRPPAPQPSYAGRSGAADDLGAHGDDVPHPREHQYSERRPGDLVEAACGGPGYLGAETAQRRHQGSQRELPADPDGRRENMQEQPDRVPADGQHHAPPRRGWAPRTRNGQKSTSATFLQHQCFCSISSLKLTRQQAIMQP